MLKIVNIELGHDYKHGYGDGATPGYRCVVEVQTGERSYEKATIHLKPDAIAAVIDTIAAEVQAAFKVDPKVDVEGSPGTPRPAEAAEMPVARDTSDDEPL